MTDSLSTLFPILFGHTIFYWGGDSKSQWQCMHTHTHIQRQAHAMVIFCSPGIADIYDPLTSSPIPFHLRTFLPKSTAEHLHLQEARTSHSTKLKSQSSARPSFRWKCQKRWGMNSSSVAEPQHLWFTMLLKESEGDFVQALGTSAKSKAKGCWDKSTNAYSSISLELKKNQYLGTAFCTDQKTWIHGKTENRRKGYFFLIEK